MGGLGERDRTERCDPDRFMIGLAYRTFLSRPLARSVFYTWQKLPLILVICLQQTVLSVDLKVGKLTGAVATT